MAARRYEFSLRVLKNISRVSAADEWSIFSTREQSILLNSFFSVKGAIYYAVLATVISSHVKISNFRAKAHLVFHWCLYNKLIHFRCYCDYQKRTTGEGSEQKKTCDKQKLSDPLLNRSLRACSQGGSGGGAGKGRRACNYVFGFECLHRKSWCEMLIGGDDNSNGARTLAMLCNWYGVGGGGKALFSPFWVAKTSETPFRAKCLN